MSGPPDAGLRIRRLLALVDRGVLSVDEVITEIHEDVRDATPYLGHPDYARVFNDSVGAFIDAFGKETGASPSAGPVARELRAYRTRWNDWYGRWTGRREALRRFDGWGDPSLAAETAMRLCDDARLDGDDRFVETAAHLAAKHGSVAAVAAIVPLEDPDRYSMGAHHGSVAAIRMLRSLADEGSVEAQEQLGRLAAVAEWTTWPLDG